MTKLKLFTLTSLCLLLANCASQSVATNESATRNIANTSGWGLCYDYEYNKSNRIYFYSSNGDTPVRTQEGNCTPSKTYYDAPQNYLMNEGELIQTSAVKQKRDIDMEQFFTGNPGARQQISLSDGSQVFASSWNNLETYNYVVVLKPNTESREAKELCRLKNYSEIFSVIEDTKKKTLEVLVRRPVSVDSKKFHLVWKTCAKL